MGRSADASADPKADPDINLADLIEAINRLEVAKKTEDKVEVQKVETYPTKNIYTGQHSLQKQPLHDQKYNNWFEPTTGFRKGNPQLLPQAAAITVSTRAQFA